MQGGQLEWGGVPGAHDGLVDAPLEVHQRDEGGPHDGPEHHGVALVDDVEAERARKHHEERDDVHDQVPEDGPYDEVVQGRAQDDGAVGLLRAVRLVEDLGRVLDHVAQDLLVRLAGGGRPLQVVAVHLEGGIGIRGVDPISGAVPDERAQHLPQVRARLRGVLVALHADEDAIPDHLAALEGS